MDWKTLISQYRYPIVGGLIGLLVALFLITFGIIKTFIILLCVAGGIYLASYLKQTGFIDRLFK
ncbi:DUF2273 domain-containing protein [Streptococcus caprae]|uniref:DUF2273 domain-containing protein n=1 Tax=Streptococcus caprae TaxID=1640501 RepID=A0ABV8CT67_9STRE